MHLDSDIVEFYRLAKLGFDRAERAVASKDVHVGLAGHTIRLRFAGSTLEPRMTPALAHRLVPAGPAPDLTILLWDSVSTDTRLHLLAETLLHTVKHDRWNWLDARHGIRVLTDDRFQTVYRLGPIEILSVFDSVEATALYWVENGSLLPYWECGSPLQTILNWWAQSHNLQYVHAAAVGSSDGALLLAGRGGSGKSTTALACLDSGSGYLADDYCMVGMDAGPRVYSLYSTAKLVGSDDLKRFPRLAQTLVNPDRGSDDKAVLNLYPGFAPQLVAEAPIRAVLLPTVTSNKEPRLLPARRSESLTALAASTLFQLPGTQQAALSRMARLVSALPCYRLELGTDISALPPLLFNLLASLPS